MRTFFHAWRKASNGSHLIRWTGIGLYTNCIDLVSLEAHRKPMLTCQAESPPVNASHGKYVLHLPRIVHSCFSWLKHQMPVLDAKDLLPLGIQVFKGAITCGNTSTPSLLATEFSVCQGTFGITRASWSCDYSHKIWNKLQARSKYDLHKQALALKFRNVVMQLAENEDYVDPTSTLGELLHERVDQYVACSIRWLSFK